MNRRIYSYDPGEVLDRTVHVETFTEHIRACEPFCHLRYGDGEWLSVLGDAGKNCDRHPYHAETMGKELADALVDVGKLHPDNQQIYVGLHCTWHQDRIQPWIAKRGLVDTVRWIGNIELYCGLASLRTLEFLKAVRDYQGDVVLVANADLGSIADGLDSRHVVIPKVNCYAEIDRIEQECVSYLRAATDSGYPTIYLVSASMAAEALIWRLWRRAPGNIFIDTGHIFDAMAGIKSGLRKYLRTNQQGIMEVIKERYQPMFAGETGK